MKNPLLLCSALLLAACAHQPPASAPPSLPPLAKGTPALPASASQTLYAAFGSTEAALSCGLKSGAGAWRAVCVNALGLRVLTLGVDAAGVVTAERGLGVPEALSPERVLADVQLALWPLADLQAAYAGSDWQVDEPVPSTRRLRLQNRLMAEVHYTSGAPWAGQLWLSNLALGYSLALITEADSPP